MFSVISECQETLSLYIKQFNKRRTGFLPGCAPLEDGAKKPVTNAHHARDFVWPAVGTTRARFTPIVTLDYEKGLKVPGIDQMFELVGGRAVESLVAQIHRNERGIPENPTITMVAGTWTDS